MGSSKRAYAATSSTIGGDWNNNPTFTFYITINDEKDSFSTSNYNYYCGLRSLYADTTGSSDKWFTYNLTLATNSYNVSTGVLTVQYRFQTGNDGMWFKSGTYAILTLIPKSYD